MTRERTGWSDQAWVERGPASVMIGRSWDTWRVGVRNLFGELSLITRTNWWTIQIKLSKTPKEAQR